MKKWFMVHFTGGMFFLILAILFKWAGDSLQSLPAATSHRPDGTNGIGVTIAALPMAGCYLIAIFCGIVTCVAFFDFKSVE